MNFSFSILCLRILQVKPITFFKLDFLFVFSAVHILSAHLHFHAVFSPFSIIHVFFFLSFKTYLKFNILHKEMHILEAQ